jgi:hypothetical protein
MIFERHMLFEKRIVIALAKQRRLIAMPWAGCDTIDWY